MPAALERVVLIRRWRLWLAALASSASAFPSSFLSDDAWTPSAQELAARSASPPTVVGESVANNSTQDGFPSGGLWEPHASPRSRLWHSGNGSDSLVPTETKGDTRVFKSSDESSVVPEYRESKGENSGAPLTSTDDSQMTGSVSYFSDVRAGADLGGSTGDSMSSCLLQQPSRIPNAGSGLFSACDLSVGTSIGEYRGVQRTSPSWDHAYEWSVPICANEGVVVHVNSKSDWQLCQKIGESFIDGSIDDGQNPLRFVNGARTSEEQAGLNLVPQFQDGKVFYVASRDIHKGEEFLIDYGDKYWKATDSMDTYWRTVRGKERGQVLLQARRSRHTI